MDVFLFLFYSLILLLAWGILTLLLRAIERVLLHHRLIPDKYRKKVKVFVALGILITSGVMVHFAYHPNKSFFEEEWKNHTGLALPEDYNIVARYADYPDFHGDYSAAVIFRFNDSVYESIKKNLLSCKKFNDSSYFACNITELVLEKSNLRKSDFDKRIGNENTVVYFCDNENLILLQSFTY